MTDVAEKTKLQQTEGHVHLTLTGDEAEALLQLLDMALKAGGLQVAQAVMLLASKVTTAGEIDAGAAAIRSY